MPIPDPHPPVASEPLVFFFMSSSRVMLCGIFVSAMTLVVFGWYKYVASAVAYISGTSSP